MNTPEPKSRTLGLDLGSLAELHHVAINPSQITHVRLTGTLRLEGRRLEIYLTSGLSVSTNFDEADRAEEVYQSVLRALDEVSP